MPQGGVEQYSNEFIVRGIHQMDNVIAKLTLCWLEKLYLAGLTLNRHECNLIPLLELILKVITSESVEEPMRGSLLTRHSRRGVVISLPFLLDYIVECFEFSFGTEVFGFMEFVVECRSPTEEKYFCSRGTSDLQKVNRVCNLINDIFMTHILSSTNSLNQTRSDLSLCGLELSAYQHSPCQISKCIDELSNWTKLDSVASRRSYRYDAQLHFTRFVAFVEEGFVDLNDPVISDLIRRLSTHKDTYRQRLISRLISKYNNSTGQSLQM